MSLIDLKIGVSSARLLFMTNTRRSDFIALSQVDCTVCSGSGVTSHGQTCRCVDRAVFRACLRRFSQCSAGVRSCSRVSLEYMADFCMVARRSLDNSDYALFRFHFLLGADWRLCSRQLGMDRGNFYHAVYRIEERLGRVFRTLKPYPLYPLADYFRGTVRGAKATAFMPDEAGHRDPGPWPTQVAC